MQGSMLWLHRWLPNVKTVWWRVWGGTETLKWNDPGGWVAFDTHAARAALRGSSRRPPITFREGWPADPLQGSNVSRRAAHANSPPPAPTTSFRCPVGRWPALSCCFRHHHSLYCRVNGCLSTLLDSQLAVTTAVRLIHDSETSQTGPCWVLSEQLTCNIVITRPYGMPSPHFQLHDPVYP